MVLKFSTKMKYSGKTIERMSFLVEKKEEHERFILLKSV